MWRYLWMLLIIWLVAGLVFSPRLYTTYLIQYANAEQRSKMYVREVTNAVIDEHGEVVVCFLGSFDKEQMLYNVRVDLSSLQAGKKIEGVVVDVLSHDLGENVYVVDYKSFQIGCPEINRATDVVFRMIDLGNSASISYSKLKPPEGVANIVYGVDIQWLQPELLVVGEVAGEKGYISLRFKSKPMPTKEYLLAFLPFTILFDSLIFPLELVQVVNFKG